MPLIRFLGSSAFRGGYAGDIGKKIDNNTWKTTKEQCNYLIKKMPNCWKIIDKCTTNILKGDDNIVKKKHDRKQNNKIKNNEPKIKKETEIKPKEESKKKYKIRAIKNFSDN